MEKHVLIMQSSSREIHCYIKRKRGVAWTNWKKKRKKNGTRPTLPGVLESYGRWVRHPEEVVQDVTVTKTKGTWIKPMKNYAAERNSWTGRMALIWMERFVNFRNLTAHPGREKEDIAPLFFYFWQQTTRRNISTFPKKIEWRGIWSEINNKW